MLHTSRLQHRLLSGNSEPFGHAIQRHVTSRSGFFLKDSNYMFDSDPSTRDRWETTGSMHFCFGARVWMLGGLPQEFQKNTPPLRTVVKASAISSLQSNIIFVAPSMCFVITTSCQEFPSQTTFGCGRCWVFHAPDSATLQCLNVLISCTHCIGSAQSWSRLVPARNCG